MPKLFKISDITDENVSYISEEINKHQIKNNPEKQKHQMIQENQFQIIIVAQEQSEILNPVKLINIGSLFAQALIEEKCNKNQVSNHFQPILFDVPQTTKKEELSYNLGKISFFCDIYNIGMSLKTVIEYDDSIYLIVSDK